MGRASRTKRLRREARAQVAVEAVNRGGRPRVHEDAAAKQRAYRLRKKLGITQESIALPVDEAASYDVDPWMTSRERERWLLSTATALGPEWLEAQLEVEAEARDAEEFGS